jgi:hypothetical protein
MLSEVGNLPSGELEEAGERKIFETAAPEKRIEEESSRAKAACAVNAADEAAAFSGVCPEKSGRLKPAVTGGEASSRVMSPLLLKTQPPSFGAWLGSSRTNPLKYSHGFRHKQLPFRPVSAARAKCTKLLPSSAQENAR